jgi:putative ATPase
MMTSNPSSQPLANLIRPETLDDFVGQSHLVAPGKPLYRAIQNNEIHSMIFWGPPGVGKTTLARIIARQTNRPFFELSAVSAGKAEVREIVEGIRRKGPVQGELFADDGDVGAGLRPAPTKGEAAKGAILFLDEIHRFNKAQQDFLLPYVEDGTIILIGATTENPSFEVISALLSRSQVFVLQSLTVDDIKNIIQRGIETLGVTITDEARDFLADYANGDARLALNLLETAGKLYGDEITKDNLKDALQSKHLRYDRAGEEHYNTISAYIKSMRTSNVDAALYYLARMVDAGEDPLFIARRMVIFASEDIGMAQPTALVIANEVFKACEVIGYPECQINMAHGTAYMALAPKSRASCDAFFEALEDVKRTGNLPIPMQLRNAPTRLMKELGYGKSDGEESLLPEALKDRKYYPK